LVLLKSPEYRDNIMELQAVIDYCSSKKAVTQEFPFDDTTLVFKTCGKMFALMGLEAPHGLNLKCDPVYAVALRQKYKGIIPGYHMNKKHWNTVNPDSDVPGELLFELIDHSYELIMDRLPKSVKTEFGL